MMCYLEDNSGYYSFGERVVVFRGRRRLMEILEPDGLRFCDDPACGDDAAEQIRGKWYCWRCADSVCYECGGQVVADTLWIQQPDDYVNRRDCIDCGWSEVE